MRSGWRGNAAIVGTFAVATRLGQTWQDSLGRSLKCVEAAASSLSFALVVRC